MINSLINILFINQHYSSIFLHGYENISIEFRSLLYKGTFSYPFFLITLSILTLTTPRSQKNWHLDQTSPSKHEHNRAGG